MILLKEFILYSASVLRQFGNTVKTVLSVIFRGNGLLDVAVFWISECYA
jgi:hypothetical protein